MDEDKTHKCYHPEIKKKMDFFLKSGDIPNIIFHGQSGSGKRTLVYDFINKIYKNNKELLKNNVMYVNCAHGKGIKFIRDELKFFAKTHINVEYSGNFKTVILSNADELTMDAQSALRRCIELFSHTTRFFIIVEDKYKLLKPILSRLCEIFVHEPMIRGKKKNLHKQQIQTIFKQIPNKNKKLYNVINKLFESINKNNTTILGENINETASYLYENGYSGIDIINYLENCNHIDGMQKYKMILVFKNIKKEFRNEQLFMLFILNFVLIRSDDDLENISFM